MRIKPLIKKQQPNNVDNLNKKRIREKQGQWLYEKKKQKKGVDFSVDI